LFSRGDGTLDPWNGLGVLLKLGVALAKKVKDQGILGIVCAFRFQKAERQLSILQCGG
jgi:hypothetical protein